MLRQLILFATLACAVQLGFAAEAGKVIFVAGKAQAGERMLALNASINEGELLSTGADGYLYIKTLETLDSPHNIDQCIERADFV